MQGTGWGLQPMGSDQSEARSLVAYSIVGNAFPDKGLDPLSMVAAQVKKSD